MFSSLFTAIFLVQSKLWFSPGLVTQLPPDKFLLPLGPLSNILSIQELEYAYFLKDSFYTATSMLKTL